jgi:hypothetical protein
MLESVYRCKDGTLVPVEARICLFESGARLLKMEKLLIGTLILIALPIKF